MIIGVDAGCLGITDARLKVGVYQMAKSLFLALEEQDTENTYLLYSFYPIEKSLLKSFGKNVKNIIVKPDRGWTKIWLPLRLLRDKPDIFVGLNQSLPLKLPLQTYKSIVIVHDLLFEQCPKLYPGSFRKLHRETKSAVHLSDKIIAVSKSTKKDIEKYYGISQKKVDVIYEGVRRFLQMTNDQSSMINKIKNPYFLFVGALKPQKNVSNLLKAFSKMKDSGQAPPRSGKHSWGARMTKLLIVGGDKWKDKEVSQTFKKLSKDIQERIHFLGVVDDGKLAMLYKNSIAFVCPSLSEGFGLTFLESLSFGVPVIGPNAGAVPEVVGNAGILIDPTSVKELTKAMEKMLEDKFHSTLSKKAKSQAAKFSWEAFAKGFLSVLNSI